MISDSLVANVGDMDGVINLTKKVGERTLWRVGSAALTTIVDYFIERRPLSPKDLDRYHRLIVAYERNLQRKNQIDPNTSLKIAAEKLSRTESQDAETTGSKANQSSETDLPDNNKTLTSSLLQPTKIPDSWHLDERHRPISGYDYPTLIKNLNTAVKQLNARNGEIYLARAAMLSLIAKYLDSLQKHKMDYWLGDGLRNDGVEAMFFSEMIHWMLHVLPELPDLDQTTNAIVEQRMLYCKEVYSSVIVNHPHDWNMMPERNLYRDKTKETVFRLSEQISHYHNNLVQRRDSIRFNDHVQHLNNCLLGLCEKTFNILYLSINGANQAPFIVEQYINPYPSDTNSNDPKTTHLGQWLLRTLKEAGINTSTYASQKELSLHEISTHLQGEHPSDANCDLTESLQDPLHPTWGHWDFVLADAPNIDKSTQASQYLRQIRELCQFILKFQFIRQNLVRTAQVTSVFGEVWVYGDTVGKAVLEELLSGIQEETAKYCQAFITFWTGYYTQHYAPYANTHNLNDIKAPSHLCLTYLDRHHKPALLQNIDDINTCIFEIKTQAQKLPQDIPHVERTKKELFRDLTDFMRFCGKEHKDNFTVIHNAWSDLEKKSGLQPFSSPQQSDLDPQSAYQEENLIRQEVQRNLESFTDNEEATQIAIETRITLDNDLFNTEKLTLVKQLAEETACIKELIVECMSDIETITNDTEEQSSVLQALILKKETELHENTRTSARQEAALQQKIEAIKQGRRQLGTLPSVLGEMHSTKKSGAKDASPLRGNSMFPKDNSGKTMPRTSRAKQNFHSTNN